MHDHSHSHGSNNRIGWAFFLNVTFTIIEFIGGILTNSTAIMADAVHDLGDSLSIGFAWFLSKVSEKGSNSEFTYGYRRLSLFGALINGLVLIIGSVWVLTEAIPKLLQPEMPIVEGMIALAVFGVLVNGFAAYKLSKGKTLNERVLNWHLLEDVLGWVAVLIVSIVLLFVDWPILDPALSILFTLYILINVAKNLWHTIRLFLQAIPDKELSKSVYKTLIELKEVDSIHHLHLWSLDGEHHVLTAHLALQEALSTQQQLELKKSIAERLSKFNLEHTTIELEMTDEQCRDASEAL
ncbi:cation transporter [Kangiella profundi]|uniref:Cation transporter n=1 Tax=Kangiella profundi TaxID=1561924 RepID=A0A2K9AR11_9GAMM|nr:cation diffusion facilitator family transporter [Kangiella profundi]AUD78853.1 cation transporter [Kangiella profundi]GGF03555.1 cobalt transporter [Kangiella profundi]